MAGDQTSDNLYLPEPIQGANEANFAVNCKSPVGREGTFAINCSPPIAVNCTDPTILAFIEEATAPNTRRAYERDLRHFFAWGGRVPASEQMIARYLAEHASQLAVSTLARRLVAIRSAHRRRSLPDPTRSELVRLTLRGIRRKCGRPQRQVAALIAG